MINILINESKRFEVYHRGLLRFTLGVGFRRDHLAGMTVLEPESNFLHYLYSDEAAVGNAVKELLERESRIIEHVPGHRAVVLTTHERDIDVRGWREDDDGFIVEVASPEEAVAYGVYQAEEFRPGDTTGPRLHVADCDTYREALEVALNLSFNEA